MKSTTTLLLVLIIGITSINAQNFQWAKAIGGPGEDNSNSIAIDGAGNVYTTGLFFGTVDFDPGAGISNLVSSAFNADIFVSKLDAAGNFVWAISIGGASDDAGLAIAVDDGGNVYVTGYFEGTVDFQPGAGTSNLVSAGEEGIFVLKLDASGNFGWAKNMGGIWSERGSAIALDGSGNVYITGEFNGTGDYDPGPGINFLFTEGDSDVFILKLDTVGNFLWVKSMGDTGSDLGLSIAVDEVGNVYTTGEFQGTVDFDPGSGISNVSSSGNEDIFISKLDANGDFVWVKRMGSSGSDRGKAIAVDGAGNVYTTGDFQGTVDFDPGAGTSNFTSEGGYDMFISKLDEDGNFVWAKSIGGLEYDGAFSIAIDGFGNVYSTGGFVGTVDFDPGVTTSNLTSGGFVDIFILKLDTNGSFDWAKRIGQVGQNLGRAVAIDASGNLYTTGFFELGADFDPGAGTSNLASVGSKDIFILKLESDAVGILESGFGKPFMLYPNPTSGNVSIDLNTCYDEVKVIIRNQIGQDIVEKFYNNLKELELNIPGEPGLYFIEVSFGDRKEIVKVVRE